MVIVPVLSTITVSTLCNFSSVAASLIKIPSRAPLPTPTIIAVGVASPSAQGQAITKMPTKETRPNERACENPSELGLKRSHIPKVKKAITSTIGTKILEILSARAWIGARLPCASSTILIICANNVSEPTLVALNVNEPVVLIVAATTASPTFFCAGIGSPVTIDSSIKETPSVITPSTGILAPGFTIIRSPCFTSSTYISTSFPPRITRAVFACKFNSFSMASPVFNFERASKYFPSAIKVITIIVTS